MGKIGDLFVKLGLNKSGFEKGIKQAKTETEGFGKSMKSFGLKAKAIWAAIGVAVTKFAGQVKDANQKLGDGWAVVTAQMTAAWDTFKQSLASFDFSNFIGNLKEATRSAKELTQALDMSFENTNAARVLSAKQQKELARLEQIFRDQGKSDKERIAAGRRILAINKEINRINELNLKKVSEASDNRFLAGTRVGATEKGRKMLIDLLGAYNSTNQELVDAINWISENTKGLNKKRGNIMISAAGSKNYRGNQAGLERDRQRALDTLRQSLQSWGNAGTDEEVKQLYDLIYTYSARRNDKDVQAVVDSFTKFKESEVAVYNSNRRIQTGIDSLVAQTKKDTIQLSDNMELAYDAVEDFADLSDVDFSGFGDYEAAMDSLVENWTKGVEELKALNAEFNEAVVGGFSSGMQTLLGELMSAEGFNGWRVLQALLDPLADMAIKEGEIVLAGGFAIEAFKESLESLNGPAAIAAGIALIGVGSAVKAGLSALASSKGSSTSAGSTYSGEGSLGSSVQSLEMTVYVKGKISGSDIVISGERTQRAWGR